MKALRPYAFSVLVAAVCLWWPQPAAADMSPTEQAAARSRIAYNAFGFFGEKARALKDERFAGAIAALRRDPSAADVDLDLVRRRVDADGDPADLTPTGRKLALLFAVQDYADPRVPDLDTPTGDAAVIAETLRQRFGYDVVVVRNPTKADIVDDLVTVTRTLSEEDRLVVHYGGHGYMLRETGMGYWLPADASAASPDNWVSNDDVTRILASVEAGQIILISDSCYAGTFTREKRVDDAARSRVDPAMLDDRRAVMVMTAGDLEPVYDGGGDGHSVFTAQLLDALGGVAGTDIGYDVYARVRDLMTTIAPQTPRYGALPSARHQDGSDYVFRIGR